MSIEIVKDVDALGRLAADRIKVSISETLKVQERFTIALSGGNTPKIIYRLLAEDKEDIDWSKLHVFWGDERVVPFNDERNNAKMAFDNLLDLVPVPREQVHIMRTDLDPASAAIAYDQLLHEYFPTSEKSFDLVLLGLGEDAHTLSLFPGVTIRNEINKWVAPVYLNEQDMYRITLTPQVVNAASSIFFIVSGEGKSLALKNVLENEFAPDRYPAQIIRPLHGKLTWLVDRAAAKRLESDH